MKYFRFTKKDLSVNVLKYGIALLAVILIGALLISSANEDPVNALELIISGSLGSKTAIGNTLRWMIPYILLGMSACVAFKSGVLNLGIEGQLYWGAWVAAIIGAYVDIPSPWLPIVCILAGGIAGMLYALIPALLKLFFRVNEMISTLMLNYMAAILTEYLTLSISSTTENLPANNIQTVNILKNAELPSIVPGTYASVGIFIALAVVIAVFLLYRYTVKGYEFKAVGENLALSKTNGINVVKTYLSVFLISGFIAGVGGAIEILGAHHHFTASFSGSLGWDGVMIAMIAVNSPFGVLLVSALWGILKSGALNMERMTTLNRFTIVLIQALFVLFVSINYRAIWSDLTDRLKRKREVKREAEVKSNV